MAYFDIGVSSEPKLYATGTIGSPTSSPVKVTLGFKPKYLCVTVNSISSPSASNMSLVMVYEESSSTTQYRRCFQASSGGRYDLANIGGTSSGTITSIDSDGFTLGGRSSSTDCYHYFAIG